MEAFFFLLNDNNNNHHHHHHFPITAASAAGGHGSHGDHADLHDIMDSHDSFSHYLDDDHFAHNEPYYSSYNYPPEVDYGGLVVDYWAPDPAGNTNAYVPDQFRADIMSDRDEWSIVERRRRQRRQRLVAYRAWARTVLKKIARYGHMTKGGEGKRILPNEQKRQKLPWLDGSNDFDVLNKDQTNHLRRRRRQERQRRRRRGINSSSSDSGLKEGQSLEARAKAVGLAEPAYHKRWYRTPKYGAHNPHSLSARAIHQYASLVSPVLSSPRMLEMKPEYRGYYRSAAARRRLIAIQKDVENEMQKQDLKERRASKKKDQKRTREKRDYEGWRKEIRANKDGGADDSDVHTGIDCTVSKDITRPTSNGPRTSSSKVSLATNFIAATTIGATTEGPENPSRALTANGDKNQTSKAYSATTATASSIARHKISPNLPVDREIQTCNKLAAVPSPGRRSCNISHTNSTSSRRSHRSYGTNRTRRSAPHRALHRGLRHTRRFLRFINGKLGKVIWQRYYRWVYPYWDIWQERKQKEQTRRKEEEIGLSKHETREREVPLTQQKYRCTKWLYLRSLFTRWFRIWPWTSQQQHHHQPGAHKNDDCPPSEKLDALEAQTHSIAPLNAVPDRDNTPWQQGNSANPLSATTSWPPNLSESSPNSRSLRRVDPIPISSDIDSGSNSNSNSNSHDDDDEQPITRNKKKIIASKGKSKSKPKSGSSESKNTNNNNTNTWTKGCVLCGLERLGAAAVGEQVNI